MQPNQQLLEQIQQKKAQIQEMLAQAQQQGGQQPMQQQGPNLSQVPTDPNAPQAPQVDMAALLQGRPQQGGGPSLAQGQQAQDLTLAQRDEINRAAGIFTNLEDASKAPTGNRDIAAENAENNRKRLEGDKINRQSDPIVNTALLNNARLDAEASGQDFNEETALKVIKSKLAAGDNNMSGVADLVGDELLDKKLAKVTKQLKLDNLITKGVENTSSRAKAMAETKKDLKALSGRGGFIKLAAGPRAALQKVLISNSEAKQVGAKMIASFKPEYFKSVNQGQKAYMALQQESGFRLSSSQKRSLAEFTKFKVMMKKFFNKYKVSISGGAVSAEEMVDLQKAVANGTMSPTEAAATLQGMMEELEEDRRLKMRTLSQGGFQANQPQGAAPEGPKSFQDALGQGPSKQQMADLRQQAQARLDQLRGAR